MTAELAFAFQYAQRIAQLGACYELHRDVLRVDKHSAEVLRGGEHEAAVHDSLGRVGHGGVYGAACLFGDGVHGRAGLAQVVDEAGKFVLLSHAGCPNRSLSAPLFPAFSLGEKEINIIRDSVTPICGSGVSPMTGAGLGGNVGLKPDPHKTCCPLKPLFV